MPGDAAPATPKRGEAPDEGPLPKLRTGMKEPERLPAVSLELRAQVTDGAHYYELALPARTGSEDVVRVHIGGKPHAVAAIERSGSELPGLMSADAPFSTTSPCLRRFGARM